MGALATAAFLRTIYEYNAADTEQDLPRCIVDCDPTIPDRTDAIRSGVEQDVRSQLADSVNGLVRRGATRIVLVCVTAHHFIDTSQQSVRERVVSLVDTIIGEVELAQGPLLMLSTEGTRKARLFENSARWPQVADRAVMPAPPVQRKIHEIVYRIKKEGATQHVAKSVSDLIRQHGCVGAIFGCTDFHLLTADLIAQPDMSRSTVIDPLRSIAMNLKHLLEK